MTSPEVFRRGCLKGSLCFAEFGSLCNCEDICYRSSKCNRTLPEIRCGSGCGVKAALQYGERRERHAQVATPYRRRGVSPGRAAGLDQGRRRGAGLVVTGASPESENHTSK